MSHIEVIEIEQDSDLSPVIDEWSCLWWGNFEEAGINHCYVAIKGGEVMGFQTVNFDGLCVAIEVRQSCQGMGVATMLVEESGCWRPEKNENPEFWAAMQTKFGW